MISFKQIGDFSPTVRFLKRANTLTQKEIVSILNNYGNQGVAALKSMTPVDSGKTAESWYYEIMKNRDSVEISFNNSNIQNGVPIAIILQYGHGTRNGGWVQGRDYINPAIQPIFDAIANKAWKEVVTY